VVKRLDVDRYYDDAYAKGLHIVLLYRRDALAEPALEALEIVEERLNDPSVRCWATAIDSEDDAVNVQACKFPQYRVIAHGAEKFAIVGVVEPDELMRRIYELER
jgi:hypothetical protein